MNNILKDKAMKYILIIVIIFIMYSCEVDNSTNKNELQAVNVIITDNSYFPLA